MKCQSQPSIFFIENPFEIVWKKLFAIIFWPQCAYVSYPILQVSYDNNCQWAHLSGKWLSFNSVWPKDAIWCQWSWSILTQVMACCLTALSHYMNQYCLTINMVLDSPHKGPLMCCFGVFFVDSLNKLLNKQSSYWLFEMWEYSCYITVMMIALYQQKAVIFRPCHLRWAIIRAYTHTFQESSFHLAKKLQLYMFCFSQCFSEGRLTCNQPGKFNSFASARFK